MLIMHNLRDVKLDYFIVKILYEGKGSITAYVMEVLWFPDLLNIVGLFQAGFDLKEATLPSACVMMKATLLQKLQFLSFGFCVCVCVHYGYNLLRKKV